MLPASTYRCGVDFFSRLTTELSAQSASREWPACRTSSGARWNANDTDFEEVRGAQGRSVRKRGITTTCHSRLPEDDGYSGVDGRDFALSDMTEVLSLLVNETLARTFYKNGEPGRKTVEAFVRPQIPWFTISSCLWCLCCEAGRREREDWHRTLLSHGRKGHSCLVVAQHGHSRIRTGRLRRKCSARLKSGGSRSPWITLPVVKLRLRWMMCSFWRSCLGVFAGLALLLAAIETYGILSYSVTERRREIGIHMALGANRTTVLGMVLKQGMRLTIVGLVAGLVAALALTRLLQTQLFNVKPSDPSTMAAVSVFIAPKLACLPRARHAVTHGGADNEPNSVDC